MIVDREGEYEFELRRWAREVEAPLAAGIPTVQHADGQFGPGHPLPVAGVRLRVGDYSEERKTEPSDKAAVFRVRLPAGRTKLQTWLLDDEQREIAGAYYVYVRRL